MTEKKHHLHPTIGLIITLIAVVAIIFYICTFKIIDNDFWWHVKAGELMWKSQSLIHTEPFSYVLAGQPYTSSHEWLSQIIFYLVFRTGGVTAAILLRGLLVAIAALVLLSIDIWSACLTAPLVILVMYVFRPSLMVRPQLFSILLVALTLLILFRYVQRAEKKLTTDARRLVLACSLLLTQLLWVNLHGGVAIFGVLFIAAFLVQGWWDWYIAQASQQEHALRELQFRGILFGAACVFMLASPNFFQTFWDLYQHRFDRTIPLVREWMPLSVVEYIKKVLPFGILTVTALFVRRRAWMLCGLIILVTGILSLQAYRHCVIFGVACAAVTIFQLAGYAPWTNIRDRMLCYPTMLFGANILVLGVLWLALWQHDSNVIFRNNNFGFGVNIAVQGAVDFTEKEKITGTLFNTYNNGGYILYRCSPRCQVFADGRNIQYGYPFLQKLMDAGTNPARWKELDAKYHFTYAIVEYRATPQYGQLLPYITNIEDDASWKLVYLDDNAAVYVRDLPQNAVIIQKDAYMILSPKALEFSDTLDALPEDQWSTAEAELQRIRRESPESIKPLLLLGNRYLATHRIDSAEKVALEAMHAQPYLPEVYELLGRISAEKQDWAEAGEYLEKAANYTHGEGQTINYDYLAMIFSKAGEQDRADFYHHKAVAAGQSSPVRSDP